MKSYLYLLLCFLFLPMLHAQQSSIYTQAAEEFGLRNPSGLSIDEMRFQGNFFKLHIRNQWWDTQMPGNPKTQSFTWLNNQGKHNLLGGALFSDKVGETRQLGLSGRYARILAEGFQVGLGLGLRSQRIKVSNLDIYDEDDILISRIGQTRWRLQTSVGIFYSLYDTSKDWNWFAGIAYGQLLLLHTIYENGQKISNRQLNLQGGLGWRELWLGGRARLSFDKKNALDIYLRKYFIKQSAFIGLTGNSDLANHTAGFQLGYEQVIDSKGINKHFLNIGIGLSKPLSSYIIGNKLIFDGRITWVLGQKKGEKVLLQLN